MRTGEHDAREAVDEPTLQALERRLRGAGLGMLSEAQLAADARALRTLRERGRVARVSGRLYAHVDALDRARDEVLELIAREGAVTLAGVRDALGISRKPAQAILEHLDGARLTRRMADDRRVLTPRARRSPAAGGPQTQAIGGTERRP